MERPWKSEFMNKASEAMGIADDARRYVMQRDYSPQEIAFWKQEVRYAYETLGSGHLNRNLSLALNKAHANLCYASNSLKQDYLQKIRNENLPHDDLVRMRDGLELLGYHDMTLDSLISRHKVI